MRSRPTGSEKERKRERERWGLEAGSPASSGKQSCNHQPRGRGRGQNDGRNTHYVTQGPLFRVGIAINYFYLMTPMERFEYMRLKIANIPKSIIKLPSRVLHVQ